ncbi:MAG: YidC/Oxa1 family membrane protein insertase [Candidatus Tokpelaia sp. JSC188]|nr:MAG: YidC/Oxa1 family membrane protein insertase [Candidatus Tokpelaia sp. JSC188]
MEYIRNYFIAVVLSLFVIIGWQFFFISPRDKNENKIAGIAKKIEQEAQQNNVSKMIEASTETPVIETSVSRPTVSSDIIPQPHSERIMIDTPQLKGSINLIGARIDDLLLKNYHMTVNKNSPNIALLSPFGSKKGYFVEFGFSNDIAKDNIPRNQTCWKIEGNNRRLTPSSSVRLVFDNGSGLIFHRTISVDEQYMFTFEDSIRNQTKETVSLASYGRVVRTSSLDTAGGTYLLHEGMIGMIGDEGLKNKTYHAISTAGGEDRIIPFHEAIGGWIGITDKYWAVAVVPSQDISYKSRFSYDDTRGAHYQSDFISKVFFVPPGVTKSITNRVFAGAKQVDVINSYEKRLNIKQFGLLIDWGWLSFITKPMFMLIDWLYRVVGNFGVAILLVTVILKVILFPLANKSYKSMARMKNIHPMLTEIRKKYENDKIKQQQAIMELYRQEKINPLAGCWPMIIQFPIFFALYKVLYITIEMRHAPFFGWIQDLASPDPTSFFNLFGLLAYDVPHFLMIGFWPIIMGITMFLQMRMNPTPPDPTQAMIFNWMPLIFTWMLANFPVGLVIYWTWNNTLSIIQQAVIMKRQGAKIKLFDNLKAFFIYKPRTHDKS